MTAYERALDLFDRAPVAALEQLDELLRSMSGDAQALREFGRILFMAAHFPAAATAFSAAASEAPGNADIAYDRALAERNRGTIKGQAVARDILLDLVERFPNDRRVLRAAAESCSGVGPLDKAAELWRLLARDSDDAEVHYQLSDILAIVGRRREAVDALRTAAGLDADRYATLLSEAEIAETRRAANGRENVKRARYPDQQSAFEGAVSEVIQKCLVTEVNASPFVTRQTSFFTMGSCFAANIARALVGLGYQATCMPIAEQINTTFANRYFIEWLQDSTLDPDLCERIAGMLPPGLSKESIREAMASADVFILTLGVGAAFFDRETGAFVMPRPSALSLRTLAEKYRFRSTSVAENVDNVSRIIKYVRTVRPSARVFITVSPVPLQMTFEFSSAIIADCVSKSTMRVVAHELVQRHTQDGSIFYFPAFEVFRWIGSHRSQAFYGTDDGQALHVSEEIVGILLRSFIEMLTDEHAVQPALGQMKRTVRLRPLISLMLIDKERSTYIYGSGKMGQQLRVALDRLGPWRFEGFIDSWHDGASEGHRIIPLSEFKLTHRDGDQIVIASAAVSDIAAALADIGITDAFDANAWFRGLMLA